MDRDLHLGATKPHHNNNDKKMRRGRSFNLEMCICNTLHSRLFVFLITIGYFAFIYAKVVSNETSRLHFSTNQDSFVFQQLKNDSSPPIIGNWSTTDPSILHLLQLLQDFSSFAFVGCSSDALQLLPHFRPSINSQYSFYIRQQQCSDPISPQLIQQTKSLLFQLEDSSKTQVVFIGIEDQSVLCGTAEGCTTSFHLEEWDRNNLIIIYQTSLERGEFGAQQMELVAEQVDTFLNTHIKWEIAMEPFSLLSQAKSKERFFVLRKMPESPTLEAIQR